MQDHQGRRDRGNQMVSNASIWISTSMLHASWRQVVFVLLIFLVSQLKIKHGHKPPVLILKFNLCGFKSSANQLAASLQLSHHKAN